MTKIKTKLILILLFIIGIFWVAHADWDLFNFSVISWTSYLNFNWEIDGQTYHVDILSGSLESVTWDDQKIYQCFRLSWTGYTDTLWEVYFWYSGYNSYICSDGKWRGYAKLGAWWWISFEDMDTQNWKVYLNSNEDKIDKWFYYHSENSNSWTGQAFTEWVWFWNWNYVKTDFQPRESIFDFIDVNQSTVSIVSWGVADWKTASILSLNIKTYSWNSLGWFYCDNISVYTWDSIFWYNWNSWLKFIGQKDYWSNLTFDGSWNYSTWIYTILSFSWKYDITLWYKDKKIILWNSTYFKSPLVYDFSLVDSDGDWKLLIGSSEIWTINEELNSDISYVTWLNSLIQFSWVADYDVINWLQAWFNGNLYFPFNVKVRPQNKFYVDNILGVYYKVTGSYNIIVSGTSYNNVPFESYTNIQNLYPSKKLWSVQANLSNCQSVKANWKDVCQIQMTILNTAWYVIPKLKFDLSIDDGNKSSIQKYTTFDLDELSSAYENWLYLSWYENTTNLSWQSKVNIYSYKPVVDWKLNISFFNITGDISDHYPWSQTWIEATITWVEFLSVINFSFSWLAVWDWILLNDNNQIDVEFTKLSDEWSISSWSYQLSWLINGCPNCSFSSGWTFVGNDFWVFPKSIYVKGPSLPNNISYYNTFYKYNLDWLNGIKTIKLKPNLYINGNGLNVVGQFYGLWLMWVANKASSSQIYNIWNIAVAGSTLPFASYIQDMKNQVYEKTRGQNPEFLKLDKYISSIWGSKIYECDSGVNVFIWNPEDINVTKNSELTFINCQINITSNILSSWWKLKIYSLTKDDTQMDFTQSDGWIISSNVYIYPSVRSIIADIITDGSILASNNTSNSLSALFISNRRSNNALKNQLYIKGKLISRNTMGGWFVNNSKVILPGGKSVNKDFTDVFQCGISAEDIAQSYDINFWRASFVVNSTYDIWYLSPIIKNKYNCTWNSLTDNKFCLKPVVLEYEK